MQRKHYIHTEKHSSYIITPMCEYREDDWGSKQGSFKGRAQLSAQLTFQWLPLKGVRKAELLVVAVNPLLL